MGHENKIRIIMGRVGRYYDIIIYRDIKVSL